jgi:hypothetical protein
MIFTLQEARDILRLDGEENDIVIEPLIQAIPDYLYSAVGYLSSGGNYSNIAKTAARFILQLWYYGENCDTVKLEKVIECLLKSLSAERVV